MSESLVGMKMSFFENFLLNKYGKENLAVKIFTEWEEIRFYASMSLTGSSIYMDVIGFSLAALDIFLELKKIERVNDVSDGGIPIEKDSVSSCSKRGS
ncbi:MAG: hypothetical protein HUJ74_00135 [Lachnospiraceae bacterium]|nr:hypothetical protein [Lachnospiraceae bacterium]